MTVDASLVILLFQSLCIQIYLYKNFLAQTFFFNFIYYIKKKPFCVCLLKLFPFKKRKTIYLFKN